MFAAILIESRRWTVPLIIEKCVSLMMGFSFFVAKEDMPYHETMMLL